MADDAYFEDTPDEAAPETSKEESADAKTALLPKDFFGSKELEVGKECKVRIESIMDDEVQVSYVPHEDKSEMESEMPTAPGDEEMAGLMADMG